MHNCDGTEALSRPKATASKPDKRQRVYRDKRGRLIVHIPMNLKKRGGRKEIVLPHGSDPNSLNDATSLNRPLALAVALGHRWLDLLTEGRFGSVQELAETIGMDPSQARRHLSLACLPPKLVRAILNGKEPEGLSVEELQKVSLNWHEQEE